jgi:hypothetical protein
MLHVEIKHKKSLVTMCLTIMGRTSSAATRSSQVGATIQGLWFLVVLLEDHVSIF